MTNVNSNREYKKKEHQKEKIQFRPASVKLSLGKIDTPTYIKSILDKTLIQ